MPHEETTTRTLYLFDELSENAKETARGWYREGTVDYEWWDGTYEQVQEAAKYLGITIDTKTRRSIGGYSDGKWDKSKECATQETCIYFSGFSSQGDGACIEGTWRASDMETLKALKAYFCTDKELHRIHRELRWYAKRYPQATCSSKHTGYYNHSRSTTLDPFLGEEVDYSKETHDGLEEALIDFMDWIYKALEAEHNYLNSDESADESIRANEYDFTEEGERA